MPTVAPPASAATLTAALSATAGTGTPAATDALAGLFQSVLAQVVSQTTATITGEQQTTLADALAQATGQAADGTGNSDLLAGLLALTEGEGEDGDDTAVNADLLSQLLATLGGNAQTLAQLQQTQSTDAATTELDATALLAVATTTTTDAGTDADLSPAVQQFLDRTGFIGLPPQANRANTGATNDTPTAAVPTTTAQTTTTELTPVAVRVAEPTTTTSRQAVTVAAATQIAGRVPAVVTQTPILSDRGQLLPVAATVEPALVQPPVTEIQAVKAAPAVAPGQSLDATRQPDIDLPIPGTAVQAPADAAKPAFTLPPGVEVTVTKVAAPPVQPTAASVTSTVPTGTAVSAPVQATPAAPGITAAVAQPILPTAPTDTLAGFAQLVSARTVPNDQPDLGPDGSGPDATAAAAGLTTQRGEPVAGPVPDRPVAAATQPTPVSDQLTAPILAHVQARPDAGETELRIRLDPPELGTVKVKIVSTGTDVRAELQVTSEAVRRVVESQLPELRQKLDEAGVRVQRMDVTTDSGGNAGTGRDDRAGRWQQEPAVPDFRPLPTGRPVRQPTATGVPRNRIDVIA